MPISHQPLFELINACLHERENYLKRKKTNSYDEPDCCVEIVRRATKGDREALEALLQVTYPIVLAGCRIKQARWGIEIEDCEDITQDTLLTMTKVLSRTDKAFVVKTFGQYVAYVKMTMFSSAMNFLNKRKQGRNESIDKGFQDTTNESLSQEKIGLVDSAMQEVDVKLSVDQLLAKCLDDPLERDVLKWRLGSGEKIEEIEDRLRLLYPEITKNEIYRILGSAVRHLNNCPEIKSLRGANKQ